MEGPRLCVLLRTSRLDSACRHSFEECTSIFRKVYPSSVLGRAAKLRSILQNSNPRMRPAWILVLLAATVLPAAAARRVTVAQLEKTLESANSAHKPDAEIARQIGGLELAERLTEPTLDRLKALLPPGSQGIHALELLADRSAFLDPPAGELPSVPAPDSSAQVAMLAAARNYVSQTLPHLPNFLANRVIDLYDDSPQALQKGNWPTRLGLHRVGTSTGEISVRNERENQPATQGSAVWQAKIGLVSGGEFGNTLGMILTDAAKGSMNWSRWEDSKTGRVAIFQYQVPASASHYEVLSTLKREENVEAVDTPGGGARGIRGIGTRPNVGTSNATIIHTKPGYHGAIWVNPADGTILRITMDADLAKGAPFRRAAILVDYGPVEIGGSTFICPVRSIALSMALTSPETITGDAPGEWLNETHFTNYHRFGSTTRILTENAAPADSNAAPAKIESSAENAQTSVPPESPATQTFERTPPSSEQQAALPAASPVSELESHKTGATSAESAASTIPSSPASSPPSEPAPQPTPLAVIANPPPPLEVASLTTIPDSGFRLHVEVPELLVPVVVRDKQGDAVGNLGKGDFAIFDQGKAREITGFSVIKSSAAAEAVQADKPASPSVSVDAAAPLIAPNRFIVFLFDDRHLTNSDLAITQKAASRMLDEPLPASDYAAVLSLSGANSGITRDRAALQAAIMKLSAHQASLHGAEDCPDVDYYAADKIVHQHDPTEFQMAVLKAKTCTHIKIFLPSGSQNIYDGLDNPTDPFQRMAIAAATRAVALGEEDAHQTLLQIESVVRAMSKLQGQRILILVSPGFLSLSPDAMTFKSRIFDQAASANVVINTLDARGLYVGNPDASQGNNATTSQILGETSSDHLAGMLASENALSELADGTGGTFFHNSNDLQGGLRSLASAPEFMYLLTISLKDVKPNGTFHQLQVKVDQHGKDVQARRGYFAPKAASNKKK